VIAGERLLLWLELGLIKFFINIIKVIGLTDKVADEAPTHDNNNVNPV
jgi:hypothetical protein